MKAALITVGDELLIGQVVNTNAAWIGNQCTLSGLELIRSVTVADSESSIHTELDASLNIADVVFLTGGLGPTHDDITRESVASFFDRPLVLNSELLENIRSRFEKRGEDMPESNSRQAMVPRGFTTIVNPNGSAPGLYYEFGEDRETKRLFLTPGVPHEMKAMFLEQIWPLVVSPEMKGSIRTKTILLTGIGESSLARRLSATEELLDDNLTLAYLPGLNKVRLRLTAHTFRDQKATERMEKLDALVHDLVPTFIYGYDNDTLESAVVGRLIEAGKTIATAESCTGGLLSNSLTNVAGSSAVMMGGVVSYSNESKIRDLGVSTEALQRHGAVSEQTAAGMAQGIRSRFDVDLGVATTGIMGPGGGSEGKPVGTVWVALADATGVKTRLLAMGEDRIRNKERTVTIVLDMIRMWIS